MSRQRRAAEEPNGVLHFCEQGLQDPLAGRVSAVIEEGRSKTPIFDPEGVQFGMTTDQHDRNGSRAAPVQGPQNST